MVPQEDEEEAEEADADQEMIVGEDEASEGSESKHD